MNTNTQNTQPNLEITLHPTVEDLAATIKNTVDGTFKIANFFDSEAEALYKAFLQQPFTSIIIENASPYITESYSARRNGKLINSKSSIIELSDFKNAFESVAHTINANVVEKVRYYLSDWSQNKIIKVGIQLPILETEVE